MEIRTRVYNIFNMEKKKHTRADLHGFTHTHTHTYTKKTHTNTQTRTTKHTFETRIRTYARPRFSLQPPSGTRQPRRPARTRFLAKRSAASAATARPTKEIYPPHAQRLMKLSIFWAFVTGLLLPLDLAVSPFRPFKGADLIDLTEPSSRLYQNRSVRLNTHWKAIDEIYT